MNHDHKRIGRSIARLRAVPPASLYWIDCHEAMLVLEDILAADAGLERQTTGIIRDDRQIDLGEVIYKTERLREGK
tara:strand:- start:1332 stop:1559 length:228 start_codon:yes stop_codon:yes gene_type:complete